MQSLRGQLRLPSVNAADETLHFVSRPSGQSAPGQQPAPSEHELGDLLDSGYRYALALCQDDHLAADLVQDAWLAVHKAGKPAPTMGYWLRSVRSRFLDHCRRGPRLVPTFNEDVDRSNEQSTNETQQEPLIAPERLTAALAHLRQEEREAIQLMVIEEMSASAAASVVGKSRGTIMSLVKRGIG